MEEQINSARKKIEQGNPKINLVEACTLNNGIISINDQEIAEVTALFESKMADLDICFFVPASGSGSRMFKDLYGFLIKPKQLDFANAANKLRDHLNQFAFFDLLKNQFNSELDQHTKDEEIISFLLTDKGLNVGALPKGLIPFHKYEEFITNPFQEHLLQGKDIVNELAKFHFTINKEFEDQIEKDIKAIKSLQSIDNSFEFSEQDPDTNAIAFTIDLSVAKDEKGNIIRRPAGHGTLINNLNKIDADLILIRNIDNIQHKSRSGQSVQTRKWLSGALLDFQSKVHEILKLIETNGDFQNQIAHLNLKYDLRLVNEILEDPTKAFAALNRPIRVCGMVKNEGAPGGGPFWVKTASGINRQIIEKSQISDDAEQIKLMEDATHFNPVELVCATKDYKGQKFDLLKFVDESQYFIVQKSQEGMDIQYIEQPGLWNGAMAEWLTLFYEIKSECFSPVKTVFDLLDDPHQPA
ncbi:DUF4301 family protein [Paracrocinitomix mangrovi]|uniref:DUF4301 family protein n=1 Tax=Paracrocinitomix mangrovi TaxID=2862509 RepID=UPI001C8E7A5C|nr:DUF4301 family protein [Paracrocinitomix mangrovi]UKN03137.1 DUF4301 family protein [Paracrocinitomix mangrovi]